MLVRTETALTYAGARVALDAALARAAEIGRPFNIAVADTAGTLLAFARMDGAFAISGSIAQDKAWTVAGFGGVATDEFYDAIAGEDLPYEGAAMPLSVAIGVSMLEDGDTPSLVLTRADREMYRIKRERAAPGRGRRPPASASGSD